MTWDDTDDCATMQSMDYYSVTEYAALRGVSRQRVHQWIGQGRIPTEFIAGAHLIPKAAGDAFTPKRPGRPSEGGVVVSDIVWEPEGSMTREEQLEFVSDLLENMKLTLVEQISSGRIPAAWDGMELRQLIADHAADNVMGTWTRARRSDYRNEVLVRNL